MPKYFLLHLACVSISLYGYPQLGDNKTEIPAIKPGFDYKKPEMMIDGIRTATLQQTGINKDFIKAMEDSIVSGAYTNIHSVLILRNNKLVYEKYFPGEDHTRGIGPIGFVSHHRDSLHDIRSVNKSVVSAAIMIAVGHGKIKNLDQRVLGYFPEYGRYDTGMKKDITIKHLLNMSAGLEWMEGSYSDTSNSERRMNLSPDALDYILSRNMVAVPGTTFNYNGGCTELLVAIIKKVSGREIDQFTDKYLFKPLGIKHYSWVRKTDGTPSGASGLRLRSRDMAKFGLVYLNNGKWKDKQIIPSYLVTQTIKKQISTPDSSAAYHLDYSNQFWIYNEMMDNKEIAWVQCQGNGGQIIIIDKKFDLVLVITAGIYNQANVRKSSWDIYLDFIYPSLVK